MGWLCALALAGTLDSMAASGRLEDAPPAAWRALATQSDVVAVATVRERGIYVIWPDKMRRVAMGSDGRPVYLWPPVEDSIAGRVVRVHLDEVFKSDAHTDKGSEQEVFLSGIKGDYVPAGDKVLLFLRNLPSLDWRIFDRYGRLSSLYGTILKYAGNPGHGREEFDVDSAYGLAATESTRGERPLLHYGADSDVAIELAIREATEAARRPAPTPAPP